MDRIKPVDIERVSLPVVTFRGYDRDAVDELLSRVSAEVETLLIELRQAQDDNERLQQDVEAFRSQENSLKNALLIAQRAAEETRSSALKEAELIIEGTRGEADLLAEDMQAKIADLRWELERLRLEKQKFLSRFGEMLEETLQCVAEAQNSEGSVKDKDDPDEGPSLRVV